MDDYNNNNENINPQIATYLIALHSEIGMLNFNDDKKKEALKVLAELDAQFNLSKPDKVEITSLMAALPRAAMISTIISSLMALL